MDCLLQGKGHQSSIAGITKNKGKSIKIKGGLT